MTLSDYDPEVDAQLDDSPESHTFHNDGPDQADEISPHGQEPAEESAREKPAPLLGCLYCHAEGTISVVEGRKILGFGSGLPSLTCQNCGSVALFELEPGSEQWRIRYKKVNRAHQYYYVMVYLGGAGWLEADEALEISRSGYVQRKRIVQTEQGDLSWLNPAPLYPPPPLMSPDEDVYLSIDPVAFQQSQSGGSSAFRTGQNDASVLDSGSFYLTDKKLHLLGHRRDWSHKLSDIQHVQYGDTYWRVFVGSTGQFYQGANHPSQLDAQLFTAVVKALMKRSD